MMLTHGPRIVTDGLVLYLDAANVKSYPGSGTTWYDLSGLENHSTLINGPTFNNKAFVLNGTNQLIETPTIINTGSSTSSQSYCVWVKPNDTDGNILTMSDSNPIGGWNMPPIVAAGSSFRGRTYSVSYLYSTNTYINNIWYYVCLIFNYDASQSNRYQKLYVNGILQNQQTSVTGYNSSGVDNYLYFGRSNPGADNQGYFAGEIGAIQIYTNKTLSESEINKNFQALRGRFGI